MLERIPPAVPPGKILVDVSNNRRVNQYPESNAEYLASLLPRAVVVKGFNVISAWAMQQSCPKDASRQVRRQPDSHRGMYCD